MKANLDKAIAFILEDEGGYAKRANEPGGAVNMGVSMTALTSWRLVHNRPRPSFVDLHALTKDEAEAIYTTNYALPIHFETLPAGLDYAALDAAVNEGVEAARAFLLVTTPIKDVKARIQALSDLRLAVKKARPEWAQFGPGWTARIGDRVVQRAKLIGGF